MPGGGAGDAGTEGGIEAGTESGLLDGASDAPGDGTVDSAQDGATDGGAEDVVLSNDGGTADSANENDAAEDAPNDAPQAPDGPPVCGDGWRDPPPSEEECDEGMLAPGARRGCSTECQVLDVLAIVGPSDAAIVTRTIDVGRHPIAVTDTGEYAVAFEEPYATPLAVNIATFGPSGVPSNVVTSVVGTSNPEMGANPVLAGLSAGRYVAAFNEFGGDGDELGVALQIVSAGNAPTGAPTFANATTVFSQYDADILAVGGQIVVAWTDGSNAATAPDLRYRVFDGSLNATTALDQTLAATADDEGDVALAAFGGSWAAAWRDDAAGLETIQIATGATTWSVGPALPGPTDDKPALAALDGTHLLVVYTEGVDLTDSGVANGSKLRAAILDTAAPGSATPFDIVGTLATGLAQSQGNAIAAGGTVFVGWRTEAAAPDPGGLGEELWLKTLGWNGQAVDLTAVEIPLPRWNAHRVGDQRSPAFAASGWAPGGALIGAWDDLGLGFGQGEANGDVAVEFMPMPVVREPGGDGGP
jgi:hypothetical protein